jgi:hypothetical protein
LTDGKKQVPPCPILTQAGGDLMRRQMSQASKRPIRRDPPTSNRISYVSSAVPQVTPGRRDLQAAHAEFAAWETCIARSQPAPRFIRIISTFRPTYSRETSRGKVKTEESEPMIV